jgi:flagellar assembly factor FliW
MTGHADTGTGGARPGRRVVATPFGRFEADQASVLTFPQGLPGFEQCRHFVLIASSDVAPLQYLHAVDGPPASFVAIDPRLVESDYDVALDDQQRERLGAGGGAPLVWLALTTLDADGRASVNLRAPIVINPASMVGLQVVSPEDRYPLRRALALD